jgi:hypothetical protein
LLASSPWNGKSAGAEVRAHPPFQATAVDRVSATGTHAAGDFLLLILRQFLDRFYRLQHLRLHSLL